MRYPTRQFSWLLSLLTTSIELLPQNRLRKAIALSPVAGGVGGAAAITAAVFGPQSATIWNVPAGVTSIIDIYGWGAGGNSGAAGAVLGGGGGGGGGFSTSGPLTVAPGQPYSVQVGAGGSSTKTVVKNYAGTTIVSATEGSTPVLDAAGAGGTAGTGTIAVAGGNGAAATALGGTGGGGGGGGGNDAAGSAAAGSVAGAGGGASTISGYGAGGSGGTGQLTTVTGAAGGLFGGGGGGPGNNGAAAGAGAPGVCVIFYPTPISSQCISVDRSGQVTVGAGTYNFLPGQTYPTIIDDAQIGNTIWEPWHVISGVAGVQMRVTEYSYDCEPNDLECLIAKYGRQM